MSLVAVVLALVAMAAIAVAWSQWRSAAGARRDAKEARSEAAAARTELDRARAGETEARSAAERATLARDSFFDLATHELRSPLAAILGYQELLQDGAYQSLDAAAEPLQRIGRSARHLLHLIEGVVELSRLRGGDLEPDLEPVNLGPLLDSVADDFRTRAEERRLEAEVRMPDVLPAVRTDRERLLRALDVIVTSAVKHPADGSLLMDVDADGDSLSITIRGTALELRDDDDPALRLGIRLAIAEGIARLLGGALTFDTVDGHITNVTFRIAAPAVQPGGTL